MSKTLRISLLLALLLSLTVGIIQAQEEGQRRGFIEGRIYKDVNGDGRCVNTGVEGEVPIEGINVQFVSSDEETVITHYSGPEGIYGLAAAGYSYWRITVQPGPEWIVTSEPTVYVPIFEDSLAKDDVDFCLSEGAQARVVALLPQSGAAAAPALTIAALVGVGFLLLGLALEWRRRAA